MHPVSRYKSKIIELGGTMQAALHITPKVLPGGKVELQLPTTTVGNEVEVFCLPGHSPSNLQHRIPS